MAPANLQWDDRSTVTSRQSNTSAQSYRSYSTAPTDYSPRPVMPHFDTCYARVEGYGKNQNAYPAYVDANRTSVETYASTTPSESAFQTDDEEEDERRDSFDPEFSVPTYYPDTYAPDAIAASPRDFASLFPTTEKLSISHDDMTDDGNMNLRLHTPITLRTGRVRSVTLFHLRMYDLRNREFSLRRYSRDSGREVCHTVRKYQKPAIEKRAGFHRSFSSALGFIHSQTTNQPKTKDIASPPKEGFNFGMQRSDSGYGSLRSAKTNLSSMSNRNQQTPLYPSRKELQQPRRKSVQLPTNTIKLEFSNYAHVDIKRRGAGSNKRYEFEYWGSIYRWQRTCIQRGKIVEVSYHLVRVGGGAEDNAVPMANIVPVPLTDVEAFDEEDKGGWIPPCSMWMSQILDDDLADIVVASGLIALVDDNIKRRFQHEKIKKAAPFRGMNIPLPIKTGGLRMEYVGPRKLLADVLGRVGSGSGKDSDRRRDFY